jgi:glycosyl transferase family 61
MTSQTCGGSFGGSEHVGSTAREVMFEASRSLASLTGQRGLQPALGTSDLLWTFAEPETWLVPAPDSVFGESDRNYLQVCRAFKTTRRTTSVRVFAAVLKNVFVSPSGVVFRKDGSLIYESVAPWQIENFMGQFAESISQRADGSYEPRLPAPDALIRVPLAVHAREGGETGYFHFINSILPRIGLLKRMTTPDRPEILVSQRQPFARDLLQALDIEPSELTGRWLRVDTLVYLSPFTFQGDHFTRPRFGSQLIREVLQPVMPPRGGGRRIYLSRSDAPVRRLANEDEISPILEEFSFETIAIGSMPIRGQMQLFAEASHLLSVHGAGLSNMIFMPEDATATEIVSPSRLWPTFRMLAARHNRRYHAVIGTSVASSDTSTRGEGNEDFCCDPQMLRMSLRQVYG